MWRLGFGGVIKKDPHAVAHKVDCTKSLSACPAWSPSCCTGSKAGGGPMVRGCTRSSPEMEGVKAPCVSNRSQKSKFSTCNVNVLETIS